MLADVVSLDGYRWPNSASAVKKENDEIIDACARKLHDRYRAVRQQSEVICALLHVDDFNLQGMAETSPPKWHLAHTTWFFETFVLAVFVKNYTPYNPNFVSLFNSYYNGVLNSDGTQATAFSRAQRGLLTRPTVREVFAYRDAINAQISDLLLGDRLHNGGARAAALQRIELGLQHEQQHQELLFTDIKYGFSLNPMSPVFCKHTHAESSLRPLGSPRYIAYDERLCEIGAQANGGDISGTDEFNVENTFCFDNELPRHRVLVHAFELAERPVSNSEYLEFIADGGYDRPSLWLADGWAAVHKNQWRAPLYWRKRGQDWAIYTLHGEVPLNGEEPLCHVSYYEADAYARWAGARLPTEAEWESVAATQQVEGHFADDGVLHPRSVSGGNGIPQQLFGDVWEWTASAYTRYPGYVEYPGAIGEYNGKFMCNQMVLRGGSCVSARSHLRASYRNFFYPSDRWQFSGIRLARSLK